MTDIAQHTPQALLTPQSSGLLKRIVVLGYGLAAYTIGCAGLFWLIFALGGLAPVGVSEFKINTHGGALLTNTALMILFGLQHSIMARPRFKNWLFRFIPEAAERATFMLMSGVATMIAIYFWQPVPGTIWSVDHAGAQLVLWTLYFSAWAYLLLATFVTNHFELMGLRQVYLYFRQQPYAPLPFTRKYMYNYSRHPMMLGFLVGMWTIPEMSVSHFVMSTLLTLYTAIGMFLEERDLVKHFGDTYRRYKKEIAIFIPKVF